MAALTAGTTAPDISLSEMKGKTFWLKAALENGPVVLAFFKVSCPVCQLTLPYLERLHRSLEGNRASIVGVSQNGKEDSALFVREFGISFPIVLDNPQTYPASNAYGLTNVPTIFYVGSDGEIEVSSVGWSRKDLDAIAHKLAEEAGGQQLNVFHAGEQVPDFKAG